jgi:hypothetical protein
VNLVSIPALDAVAMHAAAKAGDAEAREFWRTLFPADSVCWICDKPAGAGATVSIFPDPADKDLFVAAPMCTACGSLPQMYRMRLELRMLRSIWPKGKWRFVPRASRRG